MRHFHGALAQTPFFKGERLNSLEGRKKGRDGDGDGVNKWGKSMDDAMGDRKERVEGVRKIPRGGFIDKVDNVIRGSGCFWGEG